MKVIKAIQQPQYKRIAIEWCEENDVEYEESRVGSYESGEIYKIY